MKYNGSICPGCNQTFGDTDDIVVCPDCGTPQHRACYEKENRCVNHEKHQKDFSWQGKVNNEPSLPTEKAETAACPNCGYENPVGSTHCRNCGMKFTLLGMNVVDAIHMEEKRNSNTNDAIPSYKAPFTLGEGEGFDGNTPEPNQATPEQIESMLTDVLSGNAGQDSDGKINLGGPFPLDDEISAVRTNTIGNFIGTNALSYISKFKRMQSGKKLSFNFAAFFFAPYWFFFRKLYKSGIIFMTLFLAISILSVPTAMDAMEYLNGIAATLTATPEISEAQIMELYGEMMTQLTPMFAFTFAGIVIRFICGFIANPIYKKYVIENAGKAERMPDRNSAMGYMVKYGGASILIAAAAFFANELISIFISYLL